MTGRAPDPSPADKARQVQAMFDGIAPRYDFLNHFLSLGTDWYWRHAAVCRFRRLLPGGPVRLLDLCCGTGDMALAAARIGPVIGCDFSQPMLRHGQVKLRRHHGRTVRLVCGDALALPFGDATFDGATVAFGVRNFADRAAGLAELRRVLRPGGILGVLEFSHPRLPLFRQLFLLYFHRVLPALGRWISGRGGAYRYLPESVRDFPAPAEFEDQLRQAGFIEVGCVRYTFGVAALHFGRRPLSGR